MKKLLVRSPAISAPFTRLDYGGSDCGLGSDAHLGRCVPDAESQHGQNPFQIAAVAVPILLGTSLWREAHAPLRIYFVITVLALAALMLGVVPLDRQLYDGLFQRLLALAVFPPIGVGGYVLWKQGALLTASPPGVRLRP